MKACPSTPYRDALPACFFGTGSALEDAAESKDHFAVPDDGTVLVDTSPKQFTTDSRPTDADSPDDLTMCVDEGLGGLVAVFFVLAMTKHLRIPAKSERAASRRKGRFGVLVHPPGLFAGIVCVA